MSDVANQQTEEHGLPDADVRGGPQHEGFVDGEEEVQVGELGEHDRRPQGNWRSRSRGSMRELEVGLLVEVGVVCAEEGGERFDEEEEESVEERKGKGRRLRLGGCRCCSRRSLLVF